MNTKIIDGHMHLTQWVGEDGQSIFETLSDYQKNNSISYVDNMCCSNNGNLWAGYEMDQSILGAIMKIENPTVFTHGCLYIPQDHKQIKNFTFESQLEELMELGLDGMKICEFKPDAYKILNVEKLLIEYDKYISACEKYNVHMCWHVADPEDFWDGDKISEYFKSRGWFYGDGTYHTYARFIDFAYEMLDRHPGLNVVLAHSFFKSFYPDEVVELLKKYPNVNMDFAPGWEMFEGFRTHYDKWFNIFREYSHRFVYATDADMKSSAEQLNNGAQCVLRFLKTDDEFAVPQDHFAKGIKLEKKYLENILFKNHDKIVGEKPREINKGALKKYIQRYLPLMPDSKNKQMTEEYYRKNLIS